MFEFACREALRKDTLSWEFVCKIGVGDIFHGDSCSDPDLLKLSLHLVRDSEHLLVLQANDWATLDANQSQAFSL